MDYDATKMGEIVVNAVVEERYVLHYLRVCVDIEESFTKGRRSLTLRIVTKLLHATAPWAPTHWAIRDSPIFPHLSHQNLEHSIVHDALLRPFECSA